MANETDSIIAQNLALLPLEMRLAYLLRVQHDIIDDAAYWQMVAAGWIGSGTTAHLDEWLSLFLSHRRKRERLMKKSDRAVWRNLPSVVTAYRAVAEGENVDQMISWTLDLRVCERLYPGRRIVVRAVPKPAIVAYFDRRGEREIIVLPGC